MGIEREIEVPPDTIISWEAIDRCLKENNFIVEMRMIDNELAFPDEIPPADWKEIRVGTPPGMITLRKTQVTKSQDVSNQRLQVIVWGNANEDMVQAWNAIAWACAQSLEGSIIGQDGNLSATEFRQQTTFPSSFGG
ncbi:MAG: hypothetical protein ACFCD0_27880 [Gemmataceae bacterium]